MINYINKFIKLISIILNLIVLLSYYHQMD